jgi:DNA repair exonuclease SbcCD ATPase subunit
MMKLTAFRIRNFRSIVDTGWQNLSPDNITCLIGQNESGKTSILEGLKVFYSGAITEDVLRSDLSLPEVTCRFSIPQGWLLKITDNPGTELKELLSGLSHIELTRVWIADLSSEIVVSGEISQYLDSLEDAWRLYLGDVTAKLEEELKRIETAEARISELNAQESEIKAKLPLSEKGLRGLRIFGRKSEVTQKEHAASLPLLKAQLTDIRKTRAELDNELQACSVIRKAGETWRKLRDRYNTLENHLAELSVKLEERHQKMTLLIRPSGGDDEAEWKGVLEDYRRTRAELDQQKLLLERHIALSGYIMDGSSEAEAVKKVDEIIQSYKSEYNSEILGKKYFEHCPFFELFEDFGSLLPNRIDMEDIISGNEQVEGYKAARNFLSIAQLDYTFFQQPSSRILKQKIENLNQTLTRNFQDFW